MIGAIVVLFEPNMKEIRHIQGYYKQVDLALIFDNSVEDHFDIINQFIEIDMETVIYKHFSKNIGLCAALNLGMKMMSEAGCDWALILDADSFVISDILNIYKKELLALSVKDVAILAPIHIYDRGQKRPFQGTRELRWSMTSGCFYNVEIFMKMNGFMEELFLECLDLDYCFRVRSYGYHIIECGEAELQHYPAQTKKVTVMGKKLFCYGWDSPWRYYMQARNLLWIFMRYKSLEGITMYIWKWLKVLLLFKNKRQYIIQMLKGSREGLELYRKCNKDIY